MRSIVYIPTDRLSVRAIESALAECAAVEQLGGAPPVLAVIEHTDADHVSEHSRCIAALRKDNAGTVIHVTREAWGNWLASLLNGVSADTDRLKRLLDPSAVAYGAGPNKAALLASALGAEVLHRRDSDLVVDQRPGGPALPIALERAAIGGRLAAVETVVNIESAKPDDHPKTVQFVASSYFGDPPHDRRNLLSVDPNLVVELELLANPGSSTSELTAEVDEYFVDEPGVRYDTDFYELDLTGRTELGVSCVADVFLDLPEMPITDTLGCDYFQKNLLYQLRRPVLFHSRKMQHVHIAGGARGSGPEAAIEYALRDLRYLILWRVWSRHNKGIRSDPNSFLTAEERLDGNVYAHGFEAALEEELPLLENLPAEYAGVYAKASAEAGLPLAEEFSAVAERVTADPREHLQHVADGILDFAWLTRLWPELIRSAADAGADGLGSGDVRT